MKNDKNKQRYNGEETDNDQDNRRNALGVDEQATRLCRAFLNISMWC